MKLRQAARVFHLSVRFQASRAAKTCCSRCNRNSKRCAMHDYYDSEKNDAGICQCQIVPLLTTAPYLLENGLTVKNDEKTSSYSIESDLIWLAAAEVL